jgi:hypothetical protein
VRVAQQINATPTTPSPLPPYNLAIDQLTVFVVRTLSGVLGFSLFVEAITLVVATKDIRRSAKKLNMSFIEYIRWGPDPMAVSVLMEDSAAVAGVIVASICLGLTSLTGNLIFDAVGSIVVGGLLGGVAVFLVQKNRYALMGRSIRPEQVSRILQVLLKEPIIRYAIAVWSCGGGELCNAHTHTPECNSVLTLILLRCCWRYLDRCTKSRPRHSEPIVYASKPKYNSMALK